MYEYTAVKVTSTVAFPLTCAIHITLCFSTKRYFQRLSRVVDSDVGEHSAAVNCTESENMSIIVGHSTGDEINY